MQGIPHVQHPIAEEVPYLRPCFRCGDFRLGDDKFCSKPHFKSPYQWQVKNLNRGGDWENFSDNDDVERAYCDVNKDFVFSCDIDGRIIFENADLIEGVSSGHGCLYRRLCTPPSVSESRPNLEKALCIEWLWYRLKAGDNWIIYSNQDSKGTRAGLDSEAIERGYVKFKTNHGKSEVDFKAGGQSYKLDFDTMQQINKCRGTHRKVRRRPKFVSMEDRLVTSGYMREPDTRAQQATAKEVLFICPYFLRGDCTSVDDKFNHKRHFKSPYQWQMKDVTLNTDWTDLPENNEVERAYCDVNYTGVTLHIPSPADKGCFEFDQGNLMEGVPYGNGRYLVRRLSTPSSVVKSNRSWKNAFCIKWLWYWRERNNWTIYSNQNEEGTKAGLDSEAIERAYMKFKTNHSESEVHFEVGSQSYKLHLDAMQQFNKLFGTRREVRRRPKFVSMEDRLVTSRHFSKTVPVVLPTTWEKSGGAQETMKLILLCDNKSPEYNSVAKLFAKTMTETIVSITRIQNEELWEDFSKMKERMKKKNNGKPVLQKQLFHGTQKEHSDAICCENFDWRLSGSNVGYMYGRGSYFACDARKSHDYTKPDQCGHCYIFVAQVLVGDTAKGDSSYVRPPPKDPSQPRSEIYDSCVDNMQDPKIYVTFEKMQVYPEYLIEYN